MNHRWETYSSRFGQHPAFVNFNIDFGRTTDSCPYSNLVRFRIKLKAPSHSGLPTGHEFVDLSEVERALAAHIGSESGLLAGKVTCNGLRDLAFYVNLTEEACWRIGGEVGKACSYEIVVLHEEDRECQYYWQQLYPTITEWQSIKNLRQEEQLRRQGDMLTASREIFHWAYFPSDANRSAFIDQLTAMFGHEVEPVSQFEQPLQDSSSVHHIVQLRHMGCPDHQSIQPITFGIAQLAHEMGGTYDGWETSVIEPELPPSSTRVVDDVSEAMAADLVAAIQAQDYPLADQIVRSASEDDRERLVYGFACSNQAVEAASRWVCAEPTSAYAYLLLGASMLVTGWQLRSSRYAEFVDESSWIGFLSTIRDARDPLHHAAMLDPELPDPYGWLMQYEIGSGTTLEQLNSHFQAAISRSPQHWAAHFKYAMAITAKWYGNHDLSFSFAREVSSRAPSPSNLHMLVAMAYAEFALAESVQGFGELHSEDHRQRITEALYKWADAQPDDLQNKLANLRGGFAKQGLNYFAVTCYLCGAFAEAKVIMSVLEGKIECLPWTWIGQNAHERKHPELIHDRIQSELEALA